MVGTGDPAAAATAEVGERNAGVARNSSSGVTANNEVLPSTFGDSTSTT